MNAERLLKLLLQVFGGVCVIAIFPFLMPRSWMAVTHEWLGMGPFPGAPIAEYLARFTSAMCAFYGGILILFATDIRRYAAPIQYQAIVMMALAVIGALYGLRAGMPLWWMLVDALSCIGSYTLMLVLLKRIGH